MASAEVAIAYTILNEGGFSNDPFDMGGATNFGITHDDLARYLGHSVSIADVRNLTPLMAEAVYSHLYWEPMDLGAINDQNIATCIFDIGVNRGMSVGIKYAESCVGAIQDGKMTQFLTAAINNAKRIDFITSYHGLAVAGYNAIIARHPSQNVFLKGWLARADRLLTLI